MGEAIVVAIITGAMTLAGTALTVWASSRKTNNTLQVSQAVTETKIEKLTEEVRKHNNFAERIPVIEEQIKVANHRISDLEIMTRSDLK